MLGACGSHDPSPGAASGSGSSAAPGNDAPAPSARNPNGHAAAQKCAAAFATLGDLAADTRERALATACADVIVERRCRDAWLATDVPAAELAAHLLGECAAAYCPLFAGHDTLPAACGDVAHLTDMARLRAAGELWDRIRALDLAPDDAALIVAAADRARPAPVEVPTAGGVRWRVPVIVLTHDSVELRWRPAHGDDVVAVHEDLARWDCAPIREALALEVVRTWPNSVRPGASKSLLLFAGHDTEYKDVAKVMDCVQDPSGPRPLYPDVVLTPQ